MSEIPYNNTIDQERSLKEERIKERQYFMGGLVVVEKNNDGFAASIESSNLSGTLDDTPEMALASLLTDPDALLEIQARLSEMGEIDIGVAKYFQKLSNHGFCKLNNPDVMKERLKAMCKSRGVRVAFEYNEDADIAVGYDPTVVDVICTESFSPQYIKSLKATGYRTLDSAFMYSILK